MVESAPGLLNSAALALGASWASGLNAYAVVGLLGVGSWLGMVDLPPGLAVVGNPLVIGAALLLYAIEFVVDKVPGADTVWDGLQTFVRIPAGAALASGAISHIDPSLANVAALLGGGLAGATHSTKAGGRVMLHATPIPFAGMAASVTEDAAAIGAVWLSLSNPWLILGLVLVSLLLIAWLLPKIWRGIVGLFRAIGRLFGRRETPAPVLTPGPTTPADLASER